LCQMPWHEHWHEFHESTLTSKKVIRGAHAYTQTSHILGQQAKGRWSCEFTPLCFTQCDFLHWQQHLILMTQRI
jgi:hypothetical protein